jgi:methionine-rich copper-binding protein CopC
MKYAKKLVLSALFIAATAGQATAWAHATLQSATPPKDAEVTVAPKEVVMRFNEDLEPAFISAKVVDSAGAVVATEKATLDAKDATVMKLAVPALSPGKYTVQYTAVGHDGHRRKGEYSFTVK